MGEDGRERSEEWKRSSGVETMANGDDGDSPVAVPAIDELSIHRLGGLLGFILIFGPCS